MVSSTYIQEVYISNRPFMHPNEMDDHMTLEDVRTFALWHHKYLKAQ
jgi:hypothetical protein